MARARNIKPAFFANEVLTDLGFGTRLLFIGLWTIADREGRLEDRPKRIKMQLFPVDALDIDEALNELARNGFILRYESSGESFIQIVNFCKHQHPHVNEAASTIPAPEGHQSGTVQEPEAHESGAVQTPEKQESAPAETLLLKEETLLLKEETGLLEGGRDSDESPPAPKSKRATSLPDDFEPSADDRDWAARRGLDGAELERETEKFRLHYRAVGKPMKDWAAAWRGWILKAPSFQPARASPNGAKGEQLDVTKYKNGGHLNVLRGRRE